MNFVQEDQQGHCSNINNNEEEDEEIKAIEEETRNRNYKLRPLSSSSSSHRNLWLGSFDSQQDYKRQEITAANFDKQHLEFMDLSSSLASNNNEEPSSGTGGATTGGDASYNRSIEKEHMFDKVVTPSDVGKLNRLVIPKQHAEKYFPLDSSSNEKGLLLNFEDRNGKAWRFRYSYWNSSQSYVMTKGWSRFVKEKKLDAGDIVSFQRGAAESDKDRLYIDWRRRPDAPDPTSLARFQLQNQLQFQQSVRWGRFYSLPQSHLSINPRIHDHLNYSHVYPFNHHHHHNHNHLHHHQQQQQVLSFGNVPPPSSQHYYLRSSLSTSEPPSLGGGMQGGGNYVAAATPLVIDSVPVVHGKAAGKRLRLFGVNMDCPIQDESSSSSSAAAAAAASSYHHHHHLQLQSRVLPNNNNNNDNNNNISPLMSTTTAQADQYYSKKGKSSLSFDLDP
ncbi:hypothetical protein Ddye_017406 [Dipteronia dyeriana]|uniref:TF-B3 domain-containing protein n=1 Tax=Dipteronia dyeriana TaxID=168575 RepID=A0AAD9U9F1_9ROSI|nr:hypothetical protein Ddye_017406 [Dipteronia dyeriana]